MGQSKPETKIERDHRMLRLVVHGQLLLVGLGELKEIHHKLCEMICAQGIRQTSVSLEGLKVDDPEEFL